jgi:hypothetical protein
MVTLRSAALTDRQGNSLQNQENGNAFLVLAIAVELVRVAKTALTTNVSTGALNARYARVQSALTIASLLLNVTQTAAVALTISGSLMKILTFAAS